jgi:hypothetical protein
MQPAVSAISPIMYRAHGSFPRNVPNLKVSAMLLSPPPSPAKRAAVLRQVYKDAARSAELRAQEVAAVTGWMLTLVAQRGVDQAVLAAAVAEQAARTKLAAQASNNAAAARANLASLTVCCGREA